MSRAGTRALAQFIERFDAAITRCLKALESRWL